MAASGHSFTPIVQTHSLLLDLRALSGVIAVDQPQRRAEVAAGSALASLGEPLWSAGLSIENQGDIDAQSIAGAIATGTKGSGTAFGSLSSRVTSLRLVNGLGEVMDIDAATADYLRAAQVSLGMLGPVLRVGLQLVPAYRLKEENMILPMDEVLRQWDYLLAHYRHFSFWWMPGDRSADLYKLGEVPAGHCFVKLLREAPAHEPDIPQGAPNRRTDRAYRIYPDGSTVAEFHELEYMVDARDAREAVDRVQHLMRTGYPREISPPCRCVGRKATAAICRRNPAVTAPPFPFQGKSAVTTCLFSGRWTGRYNRWARVLIGENFTSLTAGGWPNFTPILNASSKYAGGLIRRTFF
ncbi:FAD-binding protein [Acerihabitans sp. KWT182]|uniref:FAD-binding protein n=1 Tax=Acerihabitans sp. KWT182 TaxID=3157919 RepID=A0AAU7QFP8_9GAMM